MSYNGNGTRDVYGELDDLQAEDLRLGRRITNLDAHTSGGLTHLDDTLKKFTSEIVRVSERVHEVESAVVLVAKALEAQAKESKTRHATVMRALRREQTKRPPARKKR